MMLRRSVPGTHSLGLAALRACRIAAAACTSLAACAVASPPAGDDSCPGGDCTTGTLTTSTGGSETSTDPSGDETAGATTSDPDADSSESDGGSPTTCPEAPNTGILIPHASLFQVIEIPILDDCGMIAPPDRVAPLVAGRVAVVRATLSLFDAWTPTEVAVRINFDSGGRTQVLTSPCAPVDGSTPSVEIMVDVPAEAMQPDAAFSISAIACGDGRDDAELAHSPLGGAQSLGVETTGAIRIHMVPFDVGGFVPDTSQPILDGFRDAVLAMYPVNDVEITVGDVEPDMLGGDVDMSAILQRLIVLQEDLVFAGGNLNPDAAGIYFYALVTGAATREEFCDTCPSGTSESGLGDRAGSAVGAAFADALSQSTLVHELGHVHGLTHSPCGDPNLQDPEFPYEDGLTHTEGWDFRTGEFIAADHHDLMGYCQPRWVSDYHYNKMVEWVHLATSWSE